MKNKTGFLRLDKRKTAPPAQPMNHNDHRLAGLIQELGGASVEKKEKAK